MRVDPTDTGGLFIGRRPELVPVDQPEPPTGGRLRRRLTSSHALNELWSVLLTVAMGLVSLSFWGPLPAAWLWLGSQVNYYSDSVSLGIATAFTGLMVSLLAGLSLLRRVDARWVVVRRRGGHRQKTGAGTRIFAATCAVGTLLFTVWLLLFSGASLAPLGLGGSA